MLSTLSPESMRLSFARAPIVTCRSRIRRLAALLATAAALMGVSTARADDPLERGVDFHISAAPLGNALIEFSTQSGIQVAAADADVSRVQSNGVTGKFQVREALGLLLKGTGLEFSRAGAQTVAIRTAAAASAVAVLPPANGAGIARSSRAAPSAQADQTPAPGDAAEIPDVTVTAPRPPTDEELAGDSVRQFILHHATVHYENYGPTGNLAHWRGGMQSICPRTFGLDPPTNAFVTRRIRAIAATAGAPVDADLRCADNVRILFTSDPGAVMDEVVQWASVYFRRGGRYAGIRRLIEYRGDHLIQGWYLTTARGSPVLNTELGLLRINLQPLWPKITQKWLNDDGDMSGIGTVILVVDLAKIAGTPMGAIADAAAMLTLSVAQTPDHCDPLPSVLDVLSAACSRVPPTSLTAGDLAFLKALYYRNTAYGSSPSRATIDHNMRQQFKGS